jgi:hypothetical protein
MRPYDETGKIVLTGFNIDVKVYKIVICKGLRV